MICFDWSPTSRRRWKGYELSEYGHPEAVFPPPAFPTLATAPAVPSKLPAQTSKAKSALRISAGVAAIAVGFWGGSASMALTSLSALLGPRFAWLGFLVGFTSLCIVITGCVEIARHDRKDMRVPALSIAFAAISVMTYAAVYVAFPVATPMLGGLVAAALGIVVIALRVVLDAWPDAP